MLYFLRRLKAIKIFELLYYLLTFIRLADDLLLIFAQEKVSLCVFYSFTTITLTAFKNRLQYIRGFQNSV